MSSLLLFFFFAAATKGRDFDPLRPRLGMKHTRGELMNESRPSILGPRDTRDEDECRIDSIGGMRWRRRRRVSAEELGFG